MSEQLLQQILDELKALKERVGNIEERVGNIESNMATKDELAEIRSSMTTELAEIRSTMATKEELAEIRSTMATKEELAEIRSTMATKDELEKVKELVSDIPLIKQAVLETNEVVKRIETTQERHERILEKLSIRSIEQETTIDALRRLMK